MREATLCLLIQGQPPIRILLGLKKKGFGAGKYGGFGGKVEEGETITAAALRELEEETGIQAAEEDLRRVGHLTFVFPYRPAWSQTVFVLLVQDWRGTASESAEMQPAWFDVEDIPYQQMWSDCSYWLPRILAGEYIRAGFVFKEDNQTVDTVEWRS